MNSLVIAARKQAISGCDIFTCNHIDSSEFASKDSSGEYSGFSTSEKYGEHRVNSSCVLIFSFVHLSSSRNHHLLRLNEIKLIG